MVPDIAGWRLETMTEYMEGAVFEQAPDWVCEVLSPSTRKLDAGAKRAVYARETVSHLWFVDVDFKMLETFELRKGSWVLLATLTDDAPVSLPPFDAETFPLDAPWPDARMSNEKGDG